MNISGHKMRAIFDRYHITSRDDRDNAMRALHQHMENDPVGEPSNGRAMTHAS